jgi:transcriptional regulator with XRE-family HTH domain
VPALPEPDAKGNYPARATIAVLLAQDLIRHRLALGLSQGELARRAGVRPETINRLEQGKRAPNVTTVDKIERALLQAEAEAGPRKARRRQKPKRAQGDEK